MWCRVQCGAGGGFPDVADEKGKVCVRPISLLMSHIGKTTGGPAGMCPPGTCATLGTIRGGTASAVGSSVARRFWRALPAARGRLVLPRCYRWGGKSVCGRFLSRFGTTADKQAPPRAGWNHPGRLKIPKDLIIFV